MMNGLETRKQEEVEHYDHKAREWLADASSKKWDTDVHGVYHDKFSSYLFCKKWLTDRAKGKKILDYGCGTGIHTILPAQLGAQVVGIDLSEESLKIARERAQKAKLEHVVSVVKMDCEAMQFSDSSFDIIFDGGAFSSIDLDRALPELARVLKPDGQIIGIETLGHNPLANVKRKINQIRGTRTSWAINHILKMDDFKKIDYYFKQREVHYFHLLSLFTLPFISLPGGSYLFKMLDRLDYFLLKLSFLQPYAFKVVFILSKPKQNREMK